ncbi:predicted protein [Naegleria gruberi]|uniref:Predicted protein n=1 Tax=Naegleria gruberi TaxID=5762 RepID=D2W5M0_NAEGR|nr:uncharacterized protein NAEGRDRAFT_44902 [Naegleria gruberi]EFC35632.1 predicted protein [Naegleria gruberi]|eukprot:XP_002668376.1 predicted protein [Naegleria gruberi strain NEG-M]
MSAQDISSVPPLFQPFKIRGLTLKNRIVVSPMCQYSSVDGFANFWHVQHIGSRIVGGAGLFIVEATGVSDIGRISPGCLGIYKDEHVDMLSKICQFTHEQGGHIGIQIGHAGRKASTGRLWEALGRKALTNEEGGWDVIGPSPIAFDDNHKVPAELSIEQIQEVIQQFVDAAKRAVKAGFDVIEIHGAHGYLISSFLSPTSNQRTDAYGGSFENRIRFLIEIVQRIRENIPTEMPLFVRVSADEYVGEEGWTMKDTTELAKILRDSGVDLLDCSSGGNNAKAKISPIGIVQGYQVPFSEGVKKSVDGLATGAVGKIVEAKFANDLVKDGKADLVLIGRQDLNDPYWPIRAAQDLDYPVAVPPQYMFAFPRK